MDVYDDYDRYHTKSRGMQGITRTEEPEFDDAKYGGGQLQSPSLDPINQAIVNKIIARADAGMKTYGVGMDRIDKDTLFWLNNLLEELLDAAVYLQRVIHDLETKEKEPSEQPLDPSW